MLFPAATFAAYIKIGTTKCPISRQKPSKQCLERSDEWSQPLPLRNRLGAMNNMLPLIVCSVFLVLGLWHFYMAATPASRETGAVPSVEGRPLFVPSARATVAVGVVLVLFAALVAGAAGVLPLGLPMFALQWLSYALALGLLARAVGEFKYVGFFKRVRGSRFATMDTFVYSPLCVLLATGVALIAHGT